jgi:putative glutathione S-transferase
MLLRDPTEITTTSEAGDMSTHKIDTALTKIGTGRFERPPSQFREWISSDGSTPFHAEAGRYHLYISWACPWAHRTAIGRRLKGLEDVISLSVVDPIRDERSWAFNDAYPDPLHGWEFLSQAYIATNPDYEGRLSVPVLWDKQTGRIVNNESGDILRMMSTRFGDLASDAVDLIPAEHLPDIDAVNQRIYEQLNNAVYTAGFGSRQDVYEQIIGDMFALLDELDERLASSRYLFGDDAVESDWRLFTTLVRFDAVYYVHFQCSLRRIADYPHLWAYTRDLYQEHGIADTVRLDEIRHHYYRTHPTINPTGIVAVQPAVIDFSAPHGRA